MTVSWFTMSDTLVELNRLIEEEGLVSLIGRTHLLIIKSLISGNKSPTEIFKEIKGQHYITTPMQVIRAMDQLQRIKCARIVGRRKTDSNVLEPVFDLTSYGKVLFQELNAKFPDDLEKV